MALCLIVGIVPSLVITHQSNSKGEEMLSDLSFEGLRLIRDTKSTQIEELFDWVRLMNNVTLEQFRVNSF